MPCVRVILVLVWKTLILVLVLGTYYVPATYVPGISRLIDTSQKKSLCACARAVCSSNIGFSVENTNLGFSVGCVLCASYVCTWYQPANWYVPTNSCIASGWWYAWYLRSAQETAVSSRVPYEVPFSSRCTTKSIAKMSPTGSLPPAVPLAITRTFRPWRHTSDDSYIYQLSLVVATATVSYR